MTDNKKSLGATLSSIDEDLDETIDNKELRKDDELEITHEEIKVLQKMREKKRLEKINIKPRIFRYNRRNITLISRFFCWLTQPKKTPLNIPHKDHFLYPYDVEISVKDGKILYKATKILTKEKQ